MPLMLLGLLSAAALSFSGSFTGSTGPDPRDQTTNKPSPEACQAARAAGRTLPGCAPADAEVDEARGDDQAPAERAGFLVCPGDRRCPR